MSAYNLSVVLLIPAAQRDLINQYAESLGWGPDNLSRELVHTDGSTWFGGHTMADDGFLEMMASPPSDGETDYTPALAVLIASIRGSGQVDENGETLSADPLTHWNEALAANGLSPVITGEVLP